MQSHVRSSVVTSHNWVSATVNGLLLFVNNTKQFRCCFCFCFSSTEDFISADFESDRCVCVSSSICFVADYRRVLAIWQRLLVPSSSNRCFTFENVLGSSLNSVKVSRFIFICECATRKISYAPYESKLSHSRTAQHRNETKRSGGSVRFGGVSFGFGSVLFGALALYARFEVTRTHTSMRTHFCMRQWRRWLQRRWSLHILLCWFCA